MIIYLYIEQGEHSLQFVSFYLLSKAKFLKQIFNFSNLAGTRAFSDICLVMFIE